MLYNIERGSWQGQPQNHLRNILFLTSAFQRNETLPVREETLFPVLRKKDKESNLSPSCGKHENYFY